MTTLIERARNGEKITLAMKFEAETNLEELRAMKKALDDRKQYLSAEEKQAFYRRLKQLSKGKR